MGVFGAPLQAKTRVIPPKAGNLGLGEIWEIKRLLQEQYHVDNCDEVFIFRAKKKRKLGRIPHGGHLDQQLFVLWKHVCTMQSQADCAKLVGICERTSHPSFLVL
jgi:hypothetical protein